MPALDRAISLAQVDRITRLIGKHLNFDVPWSHDRLFNNQLTRTKGVLGFGLRHIDGGFEFAHLVDKTHTATATASCRFNHDRQSNFFRLGHKGAHLLVVALIPGDTGNTGLDHGALSPGFVSHDFDGGIGRADKFNTLGFTSRSKGLVFREKTVTGMDTVSTRALCCIQNGIQLQIGICHRGWPNADRLISLPYVLCIRIRFRVDSHRFQAHSLGRTHHPNGNFTAIGH